MVYSRKHVSLLTTLGSFFFFFSQELRSAASSEPGETLLLAGRGQNVVQEHVERAETGQEGGRKY